MSARPVENARDRGIKIADIFANFITSNMVKRLEKSSPQKSDNPANSMEKKMQISWA
jgi:hypothetical protein